MLVCSLPHTRSDFERIILLYACTVIYDVYVLGGKGGDPVDALRIGPKRGELIIKKRYFNSTDQRVYAELLDAATGAELLPPIEYVHIVAMDRKGMTIEGTQSHQARDTKKARVDHFVQRWLCKMPGAKAELDTSKLLKRSADRLNRSMVSEFTPDDD